MISQNLQDTFVQEYLSGKSASEIAEHYGYSRKTIYTYLRKANIDFGTASERNRRYTCNNNFFESIDNEIKAYWLGFIAADGCVQNYQGRKTLSISLSNKDISHLDRFNQDMESTYSLYGSPEKSTLAKNGKTHTTKPNSKICISSEKIFDDLVKLGIVERKSLVLKFPTNLDPTLLRHYVRGYFDGDGCFYIRQSKWVNKQGQTKNYIVAQCEIVGNLHFLESLNQYFHNACGTNLVSVRPFKHSPETGKLCYGGSYSVKKIFDLFYQDATVFLSRKKDLIEPYVYTDPTRYLKKSSLDNIQEMKDLYKEGMTLAEISRRFSLDPSTVKWHINKSSSKIT